MSKVLVRSALFGIMIMFAASSYAIDEVHVKYYSTISGGSPIDEVILDAGEASRPLNNSISQPVLCVFGLFFVQAA